MHRYKLPDLSKYMTRCDKKVVAPIISKNSQKYLEEKLLKCDALAQSRPTLPPPLLLGQIQTIRDSMAHCISSTFGDIGVQISGEKEKVLFRALKKRKMIGISHFPIPVEYNGKILMQKYWGLYYRKLFLTLCEKYGFTTSIELTNLRDSIKHIDSKSYAIGQGDVNGSKVALWYNCSINAENYAPQVHETFTHSYLGVRDFLIIITPFFEALTDVQMRFFRCNHVVVSNLLPVLHATPHALRHKLSRDIHVTLSQEQGVAIEDKLRDSKLTDAEIGVVQEFARSYPSKCSNKEIAAERDVMVRTIKTQLNNVYRKLGINGLRRGNRSALIKYLKSLNRASYRSFASRPPQTDKVRQ